MTFYMAISATHSLGKALSCFRRTMPLCTKQGPYRNYLSRSLWENLTGLNRALISTPRQLRARHSRPTSVPDLTNARGWMEASPRSNVPTSSWKPSQKSGGCYSSLGDTNFILNAHNIGMRCSTSRCPYTWPCSVCPLQFFSWCKMYFPDIGSILLLAIVIPCNTMRAVTWNSIV